MRRMRGEYLPFASPDDALAYPYAPAERDAMRRNRARLLVGTGATVREKLAPLITATAADEVMITSMVFDHGARKHSYDLLAVAFGLRPAAAPEDGRTTP